jgi:X-X-X-Leu-X-X-Gly heptad repeat protein
MSRPRTRRVVVAATLVTAVCALVAQVLPAGAEESSSVDVAVARLDSAGYPLAVTLNEFTRQYDDGGSQDSADASKLTLENGLVTIGDDHRALPISVRTRYFLDGSEVAAKAITGKSGAFRVEWAITNRTQRTEKVTYTDSSTGKERTVVAATMVPFTVELAGLSLGDATFDDVSSNGVVSRSADNKANELSWTAVLAPPVFPGTAVFSVEGNTSGFALPESQIVAIPGVSGALPSSANDAAEKGGATPATLRGYITQFGDGFGELSNGLGQLKGGVDQIFSGLNDTLKPGLKSPTFDPSLYAEDSTLANNQPGLIQALELLADGLGSLMDGAAEIRTGLRSDDAAAPGVTEGLNQLVAGIGLGNEFDGLGNPLTIRASLNAIRVGLASGDANAPGIVEGLQKIGAAIGAGTEFDGSGNPLTLRATVNAIRAGLSSGNPADPAVIEGLQQIFAAIGSGTEFSGTTPLTVAAGLAAIRGALSSGDLNNPKVIEGLQQIYGSIGNGSEFSGPIPLTLAASLAGVRAALSSGDANNPAILEGLQTIFAGIGAGNEFDGSGNPLTVAASLNAIRAGLSNSNPATPGIIEGVQQVVAGLGVLTTSLNTFDSTFVANVNSQLAGLLLPGLDPVTAAIVGGVAHAGVTQANAAIAQMSAALSSGNPADPKILEGLQRIFASIGVGNEFSGQTPLTIAASLVAMRAGLSSGDANNPKIIEGVQQIYSAIGTGTEFSGTTPLTIRAGLNAIRAGLSSGNPNDPKIIEGLQQIFTAIGTGSEFSGATPLTLRASLNAIRAGLSSGNVNDPKIIEGLQTMWAALGNGSEFNGATPLTLQAGLVALQQGAATLAGGAQLIHAGIGSGDASEFGSDGSPMTVQASLVAASTGLGQLIDGVTQIVAGLGDLDANGEAVKTVTTRTSKFGNVIETPASLLYALDVSKNTVATKFVAGVGQILEALGDPNVPAATILYGLRQVSDGLALAGSGGADGADGADQLAHILARTVADADMVTALHQAGVARSERFLGLSDHGGQRQRSVFIFRQGGVS